MNSDVDILKFFLLSAIIHIVAILVFNGTGNGPTENRVNELKKTKSDKSLILTFIKERDYNQEMLDFIAEHTFDDLVKESGEICPLPPFGEYEK